MPDLVAGSTVKALDTPVTVTDAEPGSYTFTNTTFGVGTTGGTYADCGVSFVAPTTGRVMLHYAGELSNNNGLSRTQVAPVVRTGGTVGSGTVVLAASQDEAVQVFGTTPHRTGVSTLVSGLTPGDPYNVRLEHRVDGNQGTALRRRVTVVPAT